MVDIQRSALSKLQLAHWVEYQRAPREPVGNRGSALRLRGPLDVDLLRQAYQSIIDRHPALRTTFTVEDGAPMAHVYSTLRADFRCVDATDWRTGRLEQEVQRELERPFDLERESVVKLVVFAVGRDDHVLMFYTHHLHSDVLTPDLVHDELARQYHADLHRSSAGLPPPPTRTYREFMECERRLLESPRRQELLEFWRETLSDAPKVLELPADHPRRRSPANVQHTVAYAALTPSELVALREVCKACGTSTFRFLLTAYIALLHRYTGRTDLLIGIPADCRGDDFQGVLGNFVNQLVVRARPRAAMSFRALLAEVTQTVADAIEHRDLPFMVLIEELLAPGERGRTPFFQTMFHYNRFRVRPELSPIFVPEVPVPWRAQLEGWTVDGSVPHQQPSGPLELELLLGEVTGTLVGELRYDAQIFERASIERLATHFANLVRAAAKNPDAALGELELLGPQERQRILVDWNQTEQPFSQTCVHRLFEAQAARTPHAVAVCHGADAVTYAELDERANQLARRLQTCGAGPETIVALMLPRGIEVIVAILATWKAGAAYAPVDPTYPDERINLMLADCAPVAVITNRLLVGRLPADSTTLLLDAEAAEIAALDASDVGGATNPNSLAYVIFTSGSTGRPKGTLIEHRGVCNYGEDVVRRWRLGPGDRVLSFASFSFDSSIADYVGTLISGATLHVRPDQVLGGTELANLLIDQRITHACLPPAVWSTLPTIELPALKTAVTAGDVCPAEIVARFAPSRLMLNEYGPTEITVCATSYTCTQGRPVIGRPISNVRVYVLDERREPVPIGVRGELYLAGSGIARGYLGQENLTAERFVDNPFSTIPGERMYRTGDHARWLTDGNLEFLGRLDEQVKLRGFRIELGEIEAALAEIPGVHQAACLVRELETRQQLVGYVSFASSATASLGEAELRAALRRRLPDYMVPARIVVVPTMPLSAHGKIDRSILPAPRSDAPHVPTEVPTGGDERIAKLSEIWKRALQVPSVALDDDFFGLGGDSLLALEVASEMGRALGRELPASVLFDRRTLAGILQEMTVESHADRVMVTLRADGVRPRLVLFHPAGGDLLCYRALVDSLDAAWPISGLRSRGLCDASREYSTLAELALAYADEVDIQGPVVLIGWSLGGLVALEVAKQIEARGGRVAFLGLLDAHVLDPVAWMPNRFARIAGELGALAARFAPLDESQLDEIGARILAAPPSARLRVALALAHERGIGDGEARSYGGDQAVALHRRHSSFMRGYVPPRVEAPIHSYMAEQSAWHADKTTPWRASTNRLTEVIVPGNHYSMLQSPHVQTLAEQLEIALKPTLQIGSHPRLR